MRVLVLRYAVGRCEGGGGSSSNDNDGGAVSLHLWCRFEPNPPTLSPKVRAKSPKAQHAPQPFTAWCSLGTRRSGKSRDWLMGVCVHLTPTPAAMIVLTSDLLPLPTRRPQERHVSGLVNAVLSKFDSIDCVVNCAGVFGRGTFMDTPVMVG